MDLQHDKGLAGHSDADVLVHALMDALLGAAGKPDIGSYFPNDDPEWKDADSLKLLSKVWNEISSEGWSICNFDITLLAEEPKILPHVPAMKKNLAEVLQINVDQCAIKATTAEKLGCIGRSEGIMAHCVALLEKQ